MTNDYRTKTDAELDFIKRDATEAAKCAREMGNAASECKYLDQVNDACTESYRRQAGGVHTVRLTGSQIKLILDALNDRDSKVTARLGVAGPAEKAVLLRELGDHTAAVVELERARK